MYLEESMSLLQVQTDGYLVLVNSELTTLMILGDVDRFNDFNLVGISLAIAIIGKRCEAKTSVDEVIAVLKELQSIDQSKLSEPDRKRFRRHLFK